MKFTKITALLLASLSLVACQKDEEDTGSDAPEVTNEIAFNGTVFDVKNALVIEYGTESVPYKSGDSVAFAAYNVMSIVLTDGDYIVGEDDTENDQFTFWLEIGQLESEGEHLQAGNIEPVELDSTCACLPAKVRLTYISDKQAHYAGADGEWDTEDDLHEEINGNVKVEGSFPSYTISYSGSTKEGKIISFSSDKFVVLSATE